MSDKIGLVTGSFDPVTNGHIDIIKRARGLVDTLYVAIFYNPEKKGWFDFETRKRLLEEALADCPEVRVILSEQTLAVDLARQVGARFFIRGLRNAQDLDYEANLAFFNRGLAEEVETIFLVSQPQWQYVSSSRVRELLAFNADISAYVPMSVQKEVEKKREKKEC